MALLSIFITQEKTDDIPELQGRLAEGYAKILEIAERVSTVQLSNHLASEDFALPQKTALVGVVYEWAKGTDFATIAAMTDIQEGSIVRVITRLDETCREIRDAARVIGDRDLGEKIQICQNVDQKGYCLRCKFVLLEEEKNSKLAQQSSFHHPFTDGCKRRKAQVILLESLFMSSRLAKDVQKLDARPMVVARKNSQ